MSVSSVAGAPRRRAITQVIESELRPKLAADGLLLRSVQVGQVDVPADYRRGMEALLAEELESEKMRYTLELKDKQVEESALVAEAALAFEDSRRLVVEAAVPASTGLPALAAADVRQAGGVAVAALAAVEPAERADDDQATYALHTWREQLANERQADAPASLAAFRRWQDPAWKRVTVSLRRGAGGRRRRAGILFAVACPNPRTPWPRSCS